MTGYAVLCIKYVLVGHVTKVTPMGRRHVNAVHAGIGAIGKIGLFESIHPTPPTADSERVASICQHAIRLSGIPWAGYYAGTADG